MSRDRDSSRRSATGAQADRILEQALKHELRAAGTPPADAPALRSLSEGGCLDAETLGAWTDGGLSPAAMAAAEAHVSHCARCQGLVATMIRSAQASTAHPSTAAPQHPSTSSLWRWWLAPIAAGVTAVTLWMVVPEQQQVAVAPPPTAAKKDFQAPAVAETVQSAVPAPAAPATAVDQPAQRENLAAALRDDRQQAKAVGERKEEMPAREARERAALADAVAPAAAPPSPPAAAEAPAALGALQRSAARMAPPPGEEITAQSAPSASVGWFVGRAGLVLLTTDAGATFTRVNLTEALDITSVSATDARIATVTVVDGRRFRTEDGGRTWQPF